MLCSDRFANFLLAKSGTYGLEAHIPQVVKVLLKILHERIIIDSLGLLFFFTLGNQLL